MAEPSGTRYDLVWPIMLDQIIGLILAILALIYLAYAMLRPERF